MLILLHGRFVLNVIVHAGFSQDDELREFKNRYWFNTFIDNLLNTSGNQEFREAKTMPGLFYG